MDLAKLKSAEIITDYELIEKRLKERSAALRRLANQPTAFVDKEKKELKLHVPGGSIAIGKEMKQLSDADLEQRAKAVGIKWTREMAGRTIPYWMSDERPDAHGDIVRQNWRFNLFDKNPVMCNSHDWGGMPIGVMVTREIRSRVDVDYRGPALYGDSLFAPPAVSESADSVYRLASAGFLKSCSVGFVSNKVIDIKDEDERQELGLGRWGFILDENDLLELSPCTLGANPGAHQAKQLSALAQAKQKGLLVARDLTVLREIARAEGLKVGDPDSVLSQDRRLLAYARVLFPEKSFVGMKDVEATLIDPDMLEKDRRLWVNISVVQEETDGENEEPEMEMDEGEEDGEELETTRAKPRVVRDAPPSTVDEKLDALASMVEELSVSVTEQLALLRGEINELKNTANHGGSTGDDDEEEVTPPVLGGTIRELSRALEKASAAVRGS